MPKILKTKSVYYNDCNLIAQPVHEDIKSRSDIPISLHRVFVSPMDAIVGETFTKEATNLGLTVCVHRFCDVKKQIDIIKTAKYMSSVYASVGLNDWDRISLLKDYTNNWVIDCANGYLHPQIKSVIDRLENTAEIKNIVIGNIHSKEGIHAYRKYESKPYHILFRVGIAGGSVCSTSDVTGINRGQITELIECSEFSKEFENFHIIADGGKIGRAHV